MSSTTVIQAKGKRRRRIIRNLKRDLTVPFTTHPDGNGGIEVVLTKEMENLTGEMRHVKSKYK